MLRYYLTEIRPDYHHHLANITLNIIKKKKKHVYIFCVHNSFGIPLKMGEGFSISNIHEFFFAPEKKKTQPTNKDIRDAILPTMSYNY